MGFNPWHFGGGVDNVFRSLIFICFLFFSFSGSVFADTYTAIDLYYNNSYSTGSQTSAQAVCTIVSTATGHTYTVTGTYPSGLSCTYTTTNVPINVIQFASCPGGGTKSGTSCIDALSCVAPQTRNVTTGLCVFPSLTCPAGQYDGGAGFCLPIPNCNTATTQEYFSVSAKACVPESCAAGGTCTTYACLDNTKFYCPPTASCMVAGSLCSDNAADKAETDAAKAAAQALADKAAQDAQFAADQAAAAEAAKLAELQAAANAESEARIASNDINLTAEQRAQAQLDFAASAAYQAQKQAEYDNAKAAAAAAKTAADAASADNTAAQTGSSHDADSLSKRINDLLNDSNIALSDAISGNGDGTGDGTGTRTGLPSPYDKLGDAVKGVEDAVKAKKTDCELDPTKVGCSTLGDPGVSESIVPDEITFSNSHPSWGAGSCPSSVSLGHGVTFDYQPMCNSLGFFKPILISVGLLMSLFIVSGGVKD